MSWVVRRHELYVDVVTPCPDDKVVWGPGTEREARVACLCLRYGGTPVPPREVRGGTEARTATYE